MMSRSFSKIVATFSVQEFAGSHSMVPALAITPL